MRKRVLTSLAAVALAGSAFAYNAFAAAGDAPDAPRVEGTDDRGFMLDAKLAGMKAALQLTPDQEKLWRRSNWRFATGSRRDAVRCARSAKKCATTSGPRQSTG